MFARTLVGAVSLAALATAVFAFAAPARAQLVSADSATNSVLVDLGAIDNSYGASPRMGVGTGILGTMPGTATSDGPLLLPPRSAPSSRLLVPDVGGAAPHLRAPSAERAPRLTPPRDAKAKAVPKQAKSQAKAKADTRVASVAPAQSAPAPAKPALPEVALPSAPVAPTPPPQIAAPAPAAKSDAPVALSAPTPPPAIPPMEIVGPQASITPPAPAQKSPAQQKASAPATKGPTPPPAVAPPPPADTASPPPATKSAPQQQAALPPATKSAPPATKGGAPAGMEVRFAAGDANLSDPAKAALDKLSDSLKGDEKSRLQLLAYAAEDNSPSKARRLSLSRALAVRSYLISKGVRSTRIDVRALGDQVPSGEPDRVDLMISDR